MGYIRHDAIIATSWKQEHIQAAHQKAESLGLTCTPLVASPVNSYWTFVIVPDGSKEGWSQSETGEKQRAEWIEWASERDDDELKERKWYVDWAHVSYGGDDPGCARLVAANGVPEEEETE